MRHVATYSALALALIVAHGTEAQLLRTEPVFIGPESEAQLRNAAQRFKAGASIDAVDISRIVDDVKLRAAVDFQPFETGDDFSRFDTVYCVKYYSPWVCEWSEQRMTLQLSTGVERVRVDSDVSSSAVLEIAEFLKAKPVVRVDGEERTLTDAEVQSLGTVRRLGRWQYEVSVGDGSARYLLIKLERRFLSWPVGSLHVVEIRHVVI